MNQDHNDYREWYTVACEIVIDGQSELRTWASGVLPGINPYEYIKREAARRFPNAQRIRVVCGRLSAESVAIMLRTATAPRQLE